MKGDYLILNGEPVKVHVPEPRELLSGNYIYERIHTLDHEPLHLNTHLEIAGISYSGLYGITANLNSDKIRQNIITLLQLNRYPMHGAQVNLYIFAPRDEDDNRFHYLLECSRQLLYRGYEIWHRGMTAISLPYEVPFYGHKTGISVAAHNYALTFARRQNANTVISVSYSGNVQSAGEFPFFAVAGNEVFTPTEDAGTATSVEREIGIAAARKAGYTVLEQAPEAATLKQYEELFYIDCQGIVPIKSFDGHLFPNTAAGKIATHMKGMEYSVPE